MLQSPFEGVKLPPAGRPPAGAVPFEGVKLSPADTRVPAGAGPSFRRKPTSKLGLVLLNFTPSWFAVCMGTGVVSQLLLTSPHQFRGLREIAIVFYLLNILLFLTFSAMSLARYALYPWALMRELRHPTMSLYLGCIPMALFTLINATCLVAVPAFGHWAVVLVQALWWFDVGLALLSSFAIPMLIFHIHETRLESMTAVMLLPIVPTVVGAASGGILATVVGPSNAVVVLCVSYMLWGINLGLSFLVLALYLNRLYQHNLPNAEVIVSAFLPLGPLGQGCFAIVQLAKAGREVFGGVDFAGSQISGSEIFVMSVIAGLMLWGLGVWFFVHGLSSVGIRFFTGGLRFNLAYWGFVFPVGVFISGTSGLGEALPSDAFRWLTSVLTILLVLLWLGIAAGTIRCYTVKSSQTVTPCLNTIPSRDQSFLGTAQT